MAELIRFRNVVAGQMVESAAGRWLTSSDPYMGEPWSEVPQYGADELNAAVDAAHAAFVRGPWDDYDVLGTPDVDAFSDRVEVVRDKSLEGLRHPLGPTIEVTAGDRVFVQRIPDPSGAPETFPDVDASVGKFRILARPVLNADTDKMLDRLRAVPGLGDVRRLFA